MIDRYDASDQVSQRLAPHVEDDVGADERVAERRGLLEVQPLCVLAVLGIAEIEIAGNAQQLVRGHGSPRPAGATGDVRLQRAEITASVEDHGHRFAQRKPVDPQRDRDRGGVVEQRAAQ